MTDQSDLYGITDSLDPARMRSRLRRLEMTSPALRAGATVFSQSSYTQVAAKAVNSSGAVNLISTAGLEVKGAMPPTVVSGGFGYTSTTSAIHLYWDGTNSSALFVIRRADGTTFSVPGGNMNVTGLSSNTTYYFYPYWNVISNGPAVSFALGSVGSPQFAFTAKDNTALSKQNQLGHESLTQGGFTAATAASGTGGGATGGGGACVLSGTDIEMLVPGWDYEIRTHRENEWVRIGSDRGTVTAVPDHRFYAPDGDAIKAGTVRVGDWLVHKESDVTVSLVERFIQPGTKWQIVMPKGHMYFANGYLSHNLKPSGF